MSTLFVTLTGDEYRAMAIGEHHRRVESFDRCDTDGFLSQWAHQMKSQEYAVAAAIADNGGYADFPALFDLAGNIVPAKMVTTKFGTRWLVLDSWAGVYEYGQGNAVAWLSIADYDDDGITARSIKALARKGYRYGFVKMPAVVRGGGNGINVTYYAHPHPEARYESAEVVEVI